MDAEEGKKWSWSSFFLSVLVAALCLFIIKETTHEIRTSSASKRFQRVPASIDHSFDFSSLDGHSLEGAAKQRLLNSLEIRNKLHASLIELGNFVLLNDKKEKTFACGVFDHIKLQFEADGVAIDGGKPQLIVDSPCNVADNINRLTPIKIPFEKIKSKPPTSPEGLSFSGPKDLKVQAVNTPGAWPTHWVLTEITLSRRDASLQNLHITQDEIAQRKNKPFIMNW